MEALPADSEHRLLGRYELLAELARGGMAVVYLARQVEPEVIERPVVVKRMHGMLATSERLVRGFLDEAKMLTQIRHPNVVPILDVVEARAEAFLVLEHVDALSLAALMEASGERMPIPIASRILGDALAGLHAAHEAKNIRGVPLGLVHRDVSPQNVLVGADGVSRLIDFGIAKGNERDAGTTTGAVLKGKLGYFAPEQLQELEIDRRVDVFAAGVVLHEIIAGRRLFGGDDHAKVMMRVLLGETPPLTSLRDDVPPELDAVLEQALSRDRDDRYATAADFLEALAKAAPPASPIEVARYVEKWSGEVLEARRAEMRALVASPRASKRSLRSKLPLVAGAAALAIAVVGGVAVARSMTRTPRVATDPPPRVSASATVANAPIETTGAPPSLPPIATTTTTVAANASTATSTTRPPSTARRPPPAHPPATITTTAPSPSPSPSPTPTSPLHGNPYGSSAPRP